MTSQASGSGRVMVAANRMFHGNYLIQVRSGRHAGAEIPLTSGAYVLGGGSDADIVLTDEGVAPGHVELRFDGEFCRFWSLDGSVRLRSRVLGPGGRGQEKLPTEITVAGIELSLSPPDLPKPKRRPWPRRLLLGVLLVLTVVGGGIGVVMSGSVPAFSTPTVAATVKSVKAVVPAMPPEVLPVVAGKGELAMADDKSAAVEEAARELKDYLGKTGMTGRVNIQAAGLVINVSGGLLPEQKTDWLQARVWFDQTFRGRFVLVDQLRFEPGAAAPQLAIQAIWAGPGAYVIGGDGEKYGEGATLPGGWQIEQIAREQIVVSRRGERLSLVP